MGYAKIPEKDAVLLVRALGLLVSQASIYGPLHNVTQSSARSVFAELDAAVKTFGPIEIAIRDRQLLINGVPDGIGGATGKNLSDRMLLHRISGLLFLPPPDIGEFLKCITLFGSQPMTLAAEGGFEGVMKRAALRSIAVVSVAYRRVEGEQTAEEKPQAPSAVAAVRRPAPAPEVGVLDLSSALNSEDPSADEQRRLGDQPDPEALARQKRSAQLASLLREAASLLEEDKSHPEYSLTPGVFKALTQLRGLLSELTTDSSKQISVLVSQVHQDHQTIASIESAARRRGITLQLTRANLIQRYAELNQEIAQPLTVTTGVIDLLKSGSVGTLTEAQRELLTMAEESVGRVNQLVVCMNRISGLPESLTPDAGIIRESYR